jgi:hypothetical protein
MKTPGVSRQAKQALRTLRKHHAPHELICCFKELLDINSQLEFRAPIKDLLLDACKKFNFVAPFSMDGKERLFRAYALDSEHPGFACDCFDPHNGPIAEQSYRRGYDQGFAAARRMLESGETLTQIKQREKEIRAWRTRPVQIVGSPPGSDENYESCFVVPRGTISTRTRYKVFKRDDFRCQICGRSQADGIKLHVDHRVSVADGGDDEMDNFQTLCSECNLGKSSDSIN